MNDKILALDNICPSCSLSALGSVMNDLYTKLKSTPAQKYAGDLLTDSQVNILNNMCVSANTTSLGTIINGLLDASKNSGTVDIISDDAAGMIDKMCEGCFNIKLGTLIQELGGIINGMAPTPSTDTDILTFTLPNQVGDSSIDDETHKIVLTMPSSEDLTNIIATFTLSVGAIAKIDNVTQESGVTPNDFSGGTKTYTIIAEDGTTSQDWSVSISLSE